LVESNLRFVVKIAKEYRNRGLSFEDLVSEGNLGLIEAAKRFDPDRKTRFTNWAVWSIRKAIRAALCEQACVVRLPASQILRMREVRGTERALRASLGREPTRDELEEQLPKNLAGLDPIHRHGLRVSSLDEPIGEGSGLSVENAIEAAPGRSVEGQMLQLEAIENARATVDELDDQLRTVLSFRLGLDGLPPLTLTELGRRIGLTHEGVRKIECRAKERLRHLYRRRLYR
jgi:RNA polymerase primary sigma factor